MKKRLTATICVIAAFWMVAGCGTANQDSGGVNDRIVDEQTSTMTSSGSSSAGPPLSPGERYELADIVVIGSPTTYRVIQHKPALDRVYPEDVRATFKKDWVMDVRVHSFEVDQYIKGEGPDTVEVAALPGDRVSTEWEGEAGEDTKYFLYLGRPRDTDLWGGIYFADGYDGLWKISVDEDSGARTAIQELDSGDQLPLRTLIDSRTGTSLSNDLRMKEDARVKEFNEGSGEGPTGNVND
ncbi:MAG: hypothetical protein OXC95_16675 [Dehalococcoidia bacterium]|nr:hypothetical protein [Dehalococcoidia bacterium]